jgi:DNA-binding transcriptional LysR family regulator
VVAGRDADLGFGIRQASLRGLRAETLLNDALVLLAAPGHAFTRRRGLTLEDLGQQRFFIHSRRTPMIGLIERLFADHGVPFNVAGELANFETIKQFVAAGGDVAIVPSSVARADVQAGRLVAIRVRQLRIDRPVEVVYPETAALLPAPARLLDLLRGWKWDEGLLRTPRAPGA